MGGGGAYFCHPIILARLAYSVAHKVTLDTCLEKHTPTHENVHQVGRTLY